MPIDPITGLFFLGQGMQGIGTLIQAGEAGANVAVQKNLRRMAVQQNNLKKSQIRKARNRAFYKAVNSGKFIDAQNIESDAADALALADLKLQQSAEQSRFEAKKALTGTLVSAPFKLAGIGIDSAVGNEMIGSDLFRKKESK